MKKQIALCLLIINSCFLFAQKKTISGYVSDGKTQEKIIGAIIYDAKTKLGTITNNFGFYSLTLPSDSVNLLISYKILLLYYLLLYHLHFYFHLLINHLLIH